MTHTSQVLWQKWEGKAAEICIVGSGYSRLCVLLMKKLSNWRSMQMMCIIFHLWRNSKWVNYRQKPGVLTVFLAYRLHSHTQISDLITSRMYDTFSSEICSFTMFCGLLNWFFFFVHKRQLSPLDCADGWMFYHCFSVRLFYEYKVDPVTAAHCHVWGLFRETWFLETPCKWRFTMSELSNRNM